MGVRNGTSVIGFQVLEPGSLSTSLLLSITTPDQPQPPVRRLGYWWLFQFNPNPPYQCYVVEEGILRAPGTLVKIRVPPLGTNWAYRLDAEWSSPGIRWTTSIA